MLSRIPIHVCMLWRYEYVCVYMHCWWLLDERNEVDEGGLSVIYGYYIRESVKDE